MRVATAPRCGCFAGDSEDLEEGSPAEEGRWHPRQDLPEEDEERGSSGGDEGPWGAESDGDPYPELSSEGRWGSGSSGSPEALRDGRALCQRRGCSTDRGDTSGLSDTSPGPATPSRQHRGWGTAGDTIGGHRQEWSPRRSLPLHLSTDDPSPEPVPEPQTAGTGLPAPGTAGSAPTGEPRDTGNPPARQGRDRSRVPKKAAPAVVPPKPARQSRSLSPRRRTGGKGTRDPSGTGTEGTQYGRGRLNHPLPDLSKVEARVKFDQSYRPPRGRVLPARPRGPGGPIGFKSPAEIVREVLLSSGEGVPPQPPSTAALPQEFRSPRQATALVQQLQVTPSSPQFSRRGRTGRESRVGGGSRGCRGNGGVAVSGSPMGGLVLVTPSRSCTELARREGAGMWAVLRLGTGCSCPPGMLVTHPHSLSPSGCLSPWEKRGALPAWRNEGHICTDGSGVSKGGVLHPTHGTPPALLSPLKAASPL